jgi:hypothetical protein
MKNIVIHRQSPEVVARLQKDNGGKGDSRSFRQ